MSNDIYTWSSDMYPLVKKRFDDRYTSRMNLIGNICGVVKQNELTYELTGLGGYGELPVYSGGELSYADGAQIACGFGTVYEAIEKVGVSGNDAVLVVGLGPVGLACLMLCKALGATKLIGSDTSVERMELARKLELADEVVPAGPDAVKQVRALTGGNGCERAFDCSAADPGRQLAIRGARKWGKIAFVGEGGTCTFNPSPDIIHEQKTIYGSWVTTTWRMEELAERLVRWGIHPADLITHRFPLEKAGEAYALMASGKCGKVAVCFDEELDK